MSYAFDPELAALVPLLERFYRRRLAGSNEVDDLVQETLIAVHGVPEVLAVTLAYEHNPHLSSFPDSDPSTLTPATHSPCEEVQP